MPASNRGARTRGGCHDALHAHTSFSKAEMQGVVGAAREFRVDIHEIANARHLGRQDDLVAAQSIALGGFGVIECRHNHRFHHHVACITRFRELRVGVHHLGQQRLVERAPVHADADGLLVLHGALHHGAEVVVVFAPDRNVARVDAVLRKCFGAIRILAQQQMAVCSGSRQQ